MSSEHIQFTPDNTRVRLTHPREIPGTTLPAIPSKSHAHRLLIAAALSDTPVTLICPATSKDIEATADCLRAMGAGISRTAEGYHVAPIPAVISDTGASELRASVLQEDISVLKDSALLQDDSDPVTSPLQKGLSGTVDSSLQQAPSVSVISDVSSDDSLPTDTPLLNVGESGSTLRFLLPVLGALGFTAEIHMEGRLPERPLHPLDDEMRRHGITLSPQGENPLFISGRLTSGTYTIDGGISSQYITGLLLALPLLSGDSVLQITGKLESRPYVNITLQVLREFGIKIHEESLSCSSSDDGVTPSKIQGSVASLTSSSSDTASDLRSGDVSVPRVTTVFRIPGQQRYHAGAEVLTVEADWSNAAFFLAAGALLSCPVTVTGCNTKSPQGDRAILQLLSDFGAGITCRPSAASSSDASPDPDSLQDITVTGGTLHGIEIDAADIPDLVPILSVAAAFAEGTTVIRSIERLRIKESDRVATVIELLTCLGARIEELPDDRFSGEGTAAGKVPTLLQITGASSLPGGIVDSHNDHRIAMAAAIASLRTTGPVEILTPLAVRKSYPGFYEDLERLFS